MAASKILIGSCVRQDPIVFDYHLRTLARQVLPEHVDPSFVFVDDSGEPHTEQLILKHLPSATVLPADPRPSDADYVVGNVARVHPAGVRNDSPYLPCAGGARNSRSGELLDNLLTIGSLCRIPTPSEIGSSSGHGISL